MIQPIINCLYRHPKSALKRYKRFGGYIAYQKMLYGSRRMAEAASKLPAVTSDPEGLTVYFLTGKNHLYQTLFCISSLIRHTASEKFRFILVDDGSIDGATLKQIGMQLPGTEVVLQHNVAANLQDQLPASKYPHLNQKREIYPHLKKLTDIHTLSGNDWKLVLDADMLFWHRPDEIIDWLKNPTRPIHMIDCVQSYGYPTAMMRDLCGSDVPRLLNVGVIGMKSSSIHWQAVDEWIQLLEQKGGASYYLEQALTAMLIGEQACTVLDAEQYQVNPGTGSDDAILHHYVDLSKKRYFTEDWKKIS
jgi:hypothetical protein